MIYLLLAALEKRHLGQRAVVGGKKLRTEFASVPSMGPTNLGRLLYPLTVSVSFHYLEVCTSARYLEQAVGWLVVL